MIELPNAFTPNGDGLNDYFSIGLTKNIATLEIAIYNRWGEEVFTSNEIDFKWDGKLKNTECQSGVYVWVIKYTALNRLSTHINGKVTLLR